MTRKMRILIGMTVLGTALMTGMAAAAEHPGLKTDKDKVNYGIGVSVVRSFQQQGMEVDLDMVFQGMKDSLAGKQLLMDEKELRRTLNAYQVELRRKQAVARAMAAQDNRKAGESFLAENKKRDGVVTLPSGLQYEVLKAGKGKRPTDADMVEFNYRGSFVNGTEFGSTYDEGKPATVKVQEGGGIPGWSEALRLMPDGSTWRLFIPPQLAFKDTGKGRIGPNETLIFEMELLAIK